MSDISEINLAPFEGKCDILFIAGEHSGDEHAATLLEEMLSIKPDLQTAAIGGRHIAEAGAHLLYDLTESSVVGLVEVLKHYRYFKSLFRQLIEWIEINRPKIIVTIDYPGFNLRLADKLRELGITRKGGGDIVIYQYISPQIWAWKSHRRFKIAECYDEVGVIFPFELNSYADTDLEARFIGHPFCQPSYESKLSYHPNGGILLLPGSRKQAVSRIFPLMLKSLNEMEAITVETVKVVYPSDSILLIIETLLEEYPQWKDKVHRVSSDEEIQAAAVLTSSGTMSLKCALAGIPGAIVYRAHPVTYWMGKRLVKIPYLGIANIVLKQEMYPEYLQGAANPESLMKCLDLCLTSPAVIEQTKQLAIELKNKLSPPSDQSAAERVLSYLV